MATANLPKPVPIKARKSSFEKTLASARSTMMFSEVVRLAVDSFKASKVRFLLTMLGMIIGSASIILVVTLGLTGKQYALNLLASIVGTLLSAGKIRGALDAVDGKPVSYGAMFEGWDKIQVLIAAVITRLIIAVGLIL